MEKMLNFVGNKNYENKTDDDYEFQRNSQPQTVFL